MRQATVALARKLAGLPALKPEDIATSDPVEMFDGGADYESDDSSPMLGGADEETEPADDGTDEPQSDVAPESEGIAVESTDAAGGEPAETGPFTALAHVDPITLALPSTLAAHAPIGRRAGREDLIASFLMSKGPPKSKRTTRQGLDRIARLWGVEVAERMPWCDLRFEHTNALRAELINRAYKKHTIRSTLTALRGILIHACDLELIDAEHLRRATRWGPVRGKDQPPGRLVEKEEIEKLRTYCASQDGLYGRFLDATFALLFGVGLRADEACVLPIAAYDQAAALVRVRRKRDKIDELPVDEYVKAALDAWLVERLALPKKRIATDAFLVRVQKNDWVRPQTAQMDVKMLEYLLETVAKKAGIGRLTPHDLRRTFCTTLLDEGTDVFLAAGLMSHDDPKTTMGYDRRPAARRAEARRKVRIW